MHGRVAEDGAGHVLKLSTELGMTNHFLGSVSISRVPRVARAGCLKSAILAHIYITHSIDHCDEPGAAKRYLEGNIISRALMLFPAVHNWLKLSQFSILASIPVEMRSRSVAIYP